MLSPLLGRKSPGLAGPGSPLAGIGEVQLEGRERLDRGSGEAHRAELHQGPRRARAGLRARQGRQEPWFLTLETGQDKRGASECCGGERLGLWVATERGLAGRSMNMSAGQECPAGLVHPARQQPGVRSKSTRLIPWTQ